MRRKLAWTVGTRGLRGCSTSDTPVARKRSPSPGNVVANPGLTIETKALRDGSVIQHGIVGGETTGAKAAAWTVTLAPITQNITVCDGLDNNANGEVDEASCSG